MASQHWPRPGTCMREASPLGKRRSSNTRSAQRRKGTSLLARSSRSTPIKADSRRVSRQPTLIRSSPRTGAISPPAKGPESTSCRVREGCRPSGSGTWWPANRQRRVPSARARATRRDPADWLRSHSADRPYSISTTISRRLQMNPDEERPTDAMSSRVPGPDEEGPDAMSSRVPEPDEEGPGAPGPEEEGGDAMASRA